MALTSTQTKTTVTRSTRVKRNPSDAGTTAVSSTTETSNAAGRRQPRALANNEKENIDPLTGLDSFQSSKIGKKSALGVSGRANATAKPTVDEALIVKDHSARATRTRSSLSAQKDSNSSVSRPHGRKSSSHAKATPPANADSNGIQSFIDTLLSQRVSGLEESLEDTVVGRHLAVRQLETQADQYARELTVKPLADLSEAFNVSSTLTVSTSHNTTSSSEQNHPVDLAVPELDVDELTATLRLLLASADDYLRLPTVLQSRGIKRTLDSNKPLGTSRASRRSSTGVTDSSNPRPTKRVRKNSVPPPPPNSPLAFRALSLPLTSENVELLQMKDEEDTEDYHTQDETQGSSHFSSILGSLSDRAGVSFESLLLQETSFSSRLL